VTDLHVRFAGPADVAAVAALTELAYRGPAAATGWTNETGLLTGPRTSEGQVAELIGDEGSRFVLAHLDGRLVGSALIQRAGDTAHFGMFSVDPAVQGRGVGKSLLAACESTARELWASGAMTLTVISVREDTIAWYERRGYRRTGRHLPFPFHEHSGAVRTDFDLVELGKDIGTTGA
jgi:ribosomal protein S18 acetylase RimI-like enzyme